MGFDINTSLLSVSADCHAKRESEVEFVVAQNPAYLMWDGAVADAPTKLLSTVLARREHFDAEHNVANAIIISLQFVHLVFFNTPRQSTTTTKINIFYFSSLCRLTLGNFRFSKLVTNCVVFAEKFLFFFVHWWRKNKILLLLGLHSEGRKKNTVRFSVCFRFPCYFFFFDWMLRDDICWNFFFDFVVLGWLRGEFGSSCHVGAVVVVRRTPMQAYEWIGSAVVWTKHTHTHTNKRTFVYCSSKCMSAGSDTFYRRKVCKRVKHSDQFFFFAFHFVNYNHHSSSSISFNCITVRFVRGFFWCEQQQRVSE